MIAATGQKAGGVAFCVLRDVDRDITVEIWTGWGAALKSFWLHHRGKRLNLIDGFTDPPSEAGWGYKGVKLFPFPNRIRDGQFTFRGKRYRLPCNAKEENHAIHGLVYNRPFKLARAFSEKDRAGVLLTHQYDCGEPGYPFPFKLEILFTLHPHGVLQVETSVRNTGKTPMPLGDGWHPYFRTGGSISRLLLQFPAQMRLELDGRMIPTGRKERTDDFHSLSPIGSRHFDDCFLLAASDGWAEVRLCDPEQGLCILSRQRTGPKGYNYLQIYTPPHRQSIAVEPMTCPPDALNSGEGVLVLEAGEQIRFQWSVQALVEKR